MSNVAAETAFAETFLFLSHENTQLKAENLHLQAMVEKLKHQLSQLNRREFGVSAEGLAQLGLWPQSALPESAPPPKTTSVPAHERLKPVRKALPENLPREVIEIDLAAEEKACPCCGGARHVIGEEVSEKLDIVPARMTVLEYRRKKYACRACEGEMATAPMPAQIIEQGMATPGLIAHIAIAKFCDHQPLARQEKFFARHDIRIPRSTQVTGQPAEFLWGVVD